jgi:hypothetical protein
MMSTDMIPDVREATEETDQCARTEETAGWGSRRFDMPGGSSDRKGSCRPQVLLNVWTMFPDNPNSLPFSWTKAGAR